MTETRINPGSRVRMHCSLSLADGTEALTTFGEEPLDFRLGDGTLIAALEEHLIGMAAGERHTLLLGADMAYGPRDEALVHDMPLSDFGTPPEPGQIIGFTLPNGEETAGAVREIGTDRVRVDFNHPLAGHNIVFRVDILDVAGGAQ